MSLAQIKSLMTSQILIPLKFPLKIKRKEEKEKEEEKKVGEILKHYNGVLFASKSSSIPSLTERNQLFRLISKKTNLPLLTLLKIRKSQKPISGVGTNIVSKKCLNQISLPNNSTKYMCYKCGLEFEEKSDFVAHWLEHVRGNVEKSSKKKKKSGPFKCKICKTKFSKKSTLKKHLREDCHLSTEAPNEPPKAQGQSKLFSCSFCDYVTSDQSNLRQHLVVHSDLRPFKCDLCPLAFKLNSDLKKHKRECHFNERPFKCDECPSAFKNSTFLNLHKASVHSDLRPFKCRVSHGTFHGIVPSSNRRNETSGIFPSDRLHGTAHIVLRLVARKIKACKSRKPVSYSGDGSNIVSKKYPNQIKEPKNSRKFTCYNCGLEFEEKSDFVAHWLEHVRGNAEKSSKKKKKSGPFKCKICKTKFAKKSTLKKHLREDCHLSTEAPNEPPKAHGQSKLFSCSFCDYKTSHRGHLKQHSSGPFRFETFQM
ncbi:unnamed protein product [Bemisia tabaci]|uniref:C2H2-type domain-containing protein n=1 Tax=Bemisia tabaci TaxID=7038 RepID=A0A9P0AMD8_BEMTA|nr:unnamed protein product [Bemisia tabaci]